MQTNAEKFKEVFGLEADIDTIPFYCDESCPFSKDKCEETCYAEKWWLEEYQDENDPYIDEVVMDAYRESKL